MSTRKRTKKAPETFHFEEKDFAEKGEPMGTAEGMRNLTQEILSSFDARVAWLAALRQETAAKLRGFRQHMKNVRHELRRKAADLKRFLSDAETSRMRDFRAMHERIKGWQGERNGAVAGMLSALRQDRQAAAGHWQNMAAALARKRASAGR